MSWRGKTRAPGEMTDGLDGLFAAAAIRLGAGALGTTWPNPAVGAIVVKEGRVVGRGRTGRGGRPHAETEALAMAGELARGAILYASLEPCAHQGRTPPCADAVIAAGIGRVVAPIADPDPRVAGKGFEQLRAAGVEVAVGLMCDEARREHAGYLKRIEHQRPHVVLKLAVSADDAIGREGEGQVPVTGEGARRHGQALRSRFDAILVGRGTVSVDDPQLTCRLPGLADRSPVRVVLDTDGSLDRSRRVFAGEAPTWVFVASGGEERSADDAARPLPAGGSHDASVGGVRTLTAPRGEGGIDLRACLELLAREGITRVLVEGGARVARGFVEAGLADEVLLFRSPEPLCGKLVPALAGLPLSVLESSGRFRRVEQRRVGADRMTRYALVS